MEIKEAVTTYNYGRLQVPPAHNSAASHSRVANGTGKLLRHLPTVFSGGGAA